MKRKKIYLIIGNHRSLIGCWEQIEITLKTFQTAGLQIETSPVIIEGHINLIIEDFNHELSNFINSSKNVFKS